MIDEKPEHTSLCNPSSQGCSVGFPIEHEDEQRVENHVDDQSDTIDAEWNLASSSGVEDARKGCRHEHERESCGDDAKVVDGIGCNVCLQFVETDDDGG